MPQQQWSLILFSRCLKGVRRARAAGGGVQHPRTLVAVRVELLLQNTRLAPRHGEQRLLAHVGAVVEQRVLDDNCKVFLMNQRAVLRELEEGELPRVVLPSVRAQSGDLGQPLQRLADVLGVAPLAFGRQKGLALGVARQPLLGGAENIVVDVFGASAAVGYHEHGHRRPGGEVRLVEGIADPLERTRVCQDRGGDARRHTTHERSSTDQASGQQWQGTALRVSCRQPTCLHRQRGEPWASGSRRRKYRSRSRIFRASSLRRWVSIQRRLGWQKRAEPGYKIAGSRLADARKGPASLPSTITKWV